jgi:hypothetical protein
VPFASHNAAEKGRMLLAAKREIDKKTTSITGTKLPCTTLAIGKDSGGRRDAIPRD